MTVMTLITCRAATVSVCPQNHSWMHLWLQCRPNVVHMGNGWPFTCRSA